MRPLATKGRLQPREEPLRAPSSIFPSDQEGDSKEIEELETSEIVKTCMLALLECLSLPRYSLLSRYFLVSFDDDDDDDDDVRCTGRLHTHRTLLFMPVSTYVRSSQHVRVERVIYRVSQSNSATLKFSLFLSLFLVWMLRSCTNGSEGLSTNRSAAWKWSQFSTSKHTCTTIVFRRS